MHRRSDYHYDLPEALIAQAPADRRDHSRLLVVGAEHADDARALEDARFPDIVELIPANAVLVVNDTRVFPARLRAQKPTGGIVELLFLEQVPAPASRSAAYGERWRCMARSSKRLRAGNELRVIVRDRERAGHDRPSKERVYVASERAADSTVLIDVRGRALDLLERCGDIPLPPYIARPGGASERDMERYQTVYARELGAVAAPTAGLHFTPEILDALRERGVEFATITLHVGMGTFAPVRVQELADHQMHTERYTISESTAAAVNRAKQAGRPVVAVGTTVVRTLESAAAGSHAISPGTSTTNLFIRPGYRFRIVDRLVTNFHLPESTLLMLVCAFAGYERTMAAYAHAVRAEYRFFSYGDAMLVSRAESAARERDGA